MKEKSTHKIIETITMNRQAGDTFLVKMKTEARAMTGIPVPSTSDANKFMMDPAQAPPGKTGALFEGGFEEIEFIEKV